MKIMCKTIQVMHDFDETDNFSIQRTQTMLNVLITYQYYASGLFWIVLSL